jgi:hypothetical protein
MWTDDVAITVDFDHPASTCGVSVLVLGQVKVQGASLVSIRT